MQENEIQNNDSQPIAGPDNHSELEPQHDEVNLAELNDDLSIDQEGHEQVYVMEGDHHEEGEVNYNTLSKEELVALAVKVSKQDDLADAVIVLRNVRPLLEHIFQEENSLALQKFIEEGNEKDNFSPKFDELKQKFYDAFKLVQQRKADQRKRSEQEKLDNLAKKREILNRLKELTETVETDNSLEQVKELQRDWKKIKSVPQEFVQELWDSYRFYLDKFYDNVSINNELKELDRKKNLDLKIELCQKVQELLEEKSIKKSMILLNKYHEEWKNIGPVPKEFSEELWKRFKEASDKAYEVKKAEMAKMQEVREQNLNLKKALLEKISLIADVAYTSPRAWIDKTKEIQEIFEEWKKIGRVPLEHNDEIWKKFRDIRGVFFNHKNVFFKKINQEKTDNLNAKLRLCEQAEALAQSDDWNHVSNELKRLQQDWRKIGPVHEKYNDEVWARFRAACDGFFQRKDGHFKHQKAEQEVNFEKKQGIINELKQLAEGEIDVDKAFNRLKEIRNEWMTIGFVPIEKKNEIQQQYNELNDVIYRRLKRNPEEMNESRLKEHYQDMSGMPDAEYRLRGEEKKVREKIRFIKNEIATLENNIGFFSQGNSKSENPLVKQIREKIEQANGRLNRLTAELKVIQTAIKAPQS